MSSSARADAGGGDTVSRILAVATALFARHGFDHVSMNAVAEAAGVSKANVFHHFQSKDALYLRAMRQACDASQSSLDALAEGEGDAWQRIRRFIDDHLRHLLDNAPDSRLILREVVENRPGSGQLLAQQVFRENFNRLVAIIRDCQREGALRADLDPIFVSTLMLGANVFFFQSQEVMRHLDGVDFADDPTRYGAMFADILMRGAMGGPAVSEDDKS